MLSWCSPHLSAGCRAPSPGPSALTTTRLPTRRSHPRTCSRISRSASPHSFPATRPQASSAKTTKNPLLARRMSPTKVSVTPNPAPSSIPPPAPADLYEHRPVVCRTFGPPMRTSEGDLATCELCFITASTEEIAACELDPTIPALEAASNEVYDTGTSSLRRNPCRIWRSDAAEPVHFVCAGAGPGNKIRPPLGSSGTTGRLSLPASLM